MFSWPKLRYPSLNCLAKCSRPTWRDIETHFRSKKMWVNAKCWLYLRDAHFEVVVEVITCFNSSTDMKWLALSECVSQDDKLSSLVSPSISFLYYDLYFFYLPCNFFLLTTTKYALFKYLKSNEYLLSILIMFYRFILIIKYWYFIIRNIILAQVF